MTEVGELQNLSKSRGLVLLLASFFGLAAGLCTVFALVVTAAEGWQDHIHVQWPETTAQVRRCDLDNYTHNPEYYRIDCSVGYRVDGEEIASHVYSRSTPAPRRFFWQSALERLETLQEWVDEHPTGRQSRCITIL